MREISFMDQAHAWLIKTYTYKKDIRHKIKAAVKNMTTNSKHPEASFTTVNHRKQFIISSIVNSV